MTAALRMVDAPPIIGEVQAEKARRRFREFFRQAWPVLEPSTPLIWTRAIERTCDEVQAALEEWRAARAEGRAHRWPNVLFNLPPGTAKSRIISVAAPAWWWLHCPDWRVICVSGSPRVALRDSMLCRELIESEWYQKSFKPLWKMNESVGVTPDGEVDEEYVSLLDWGMAPDQNAKSLFKNSRGGWRLALSVGSKITGERGDAILPDDPNDVNKSNSKAELENVNLWWRGAGNRLNDMRFGLRMAVQQRVAENDFSGQALAEGTWRHVRLPVVYEAANSCPCPSCERGDFKDWRTEPGAEPNLCPERFTEEVLAAERARLGEAGYSAQYFQRPVPLDGVIFKDGWWRFWRFDYQDLDPRIEERRIKVLPPRFDETVISVDCAFKDTKHSDLVAIGRWARLLADRFLLELIWGRLGFSATLDAIRGMRNDDSWPTPTAVWVEDKANGPAVIETLQKEFPGVTPINPEGGKEGRAIVTARQVESGNVYIPLHWTRRAEYMAEHAGFPGNATHDDAVDQQSQVLLRWSVKGPTAGFHQRPGQRAQRRM
jgi:predicted phage terminase large subunit-like protein